MEENSNIIEERKAKLNKFLFGWIQDNHDKIFLAILVLSFVVRFIIFLKTMNQPLWWDGADYLATAKRWGLGLNIRDIWYYRRGFLFPLIGAIFFRLGLGEIGIRFLIVLFSTGIILLSYLIIGKMFNKKLALLTSIALSFSWILLFFTGRVLTDIPAAFFILLSLLLFWKGYILKQGNKFIYLFGLFFAFAVLTRMQSFMLIPPLFIYIFIKEKFRILKNKLLWITLGIFLILLLPHFIIYSMHYGNPIADMASHYLGIGEKAAATGYQRTLSFAIFNYILDLPYMMSKTMFVMLIIGIFFFFMDLFIGFDKIFKKESLQNKFFVLYWILSLFLIAVFPLVKFEEILAKNTKLNNKIIGILIVIILLLLLYSKITWTNNLIENKKNSYLEVKQAGEWIKANSNPNDIIISNSLPQITYYSERSTYPFDIRGEGIQRRNEELLKYREGIDGFEEFVKEKKPRYMVLSIFESHDDWMSSYPQKHNNTLIPVQVYQQNGQPVLVIYEFNY